MGRARPAPQRRELDPQQRTQHHGRHREQVRHSSADHQRDEPVRRSQVDRVDRGTIRAESRELERDDGSDGRQDREPARPRDESTCGAERQRTGHPDQRIPGGDGSSWRHLRREDADDGGERDRGQHRDTPVRPDRCVHEPTSDPSLGRERGGGTVPCVSRGGPGGPGRSAAARCRLSPVGLRSGA